MGTRTTSTHIFNPLLLVVAVCYLSLAASTRVVISNAKPRLDTEGRVVDCHNGPIVHANGTYYLYGEWYGNGNFAVTGANDLPKLAVYTSPNMTSGSWEFRGLLHNNTAPGWSASPHWPWAPAGAWYSPSAVYSKKRKKFVIYWSASQAECCEAQWGVAESDDGVSFDLVSMTAAASLNSSLDGSSLLIDDDGVGYIAYDAMKAPGMKDHVVAIDRLSPDLLSSSGERMALFPDYFVEGALLFKRTGRYYLMYGSCCCACRQGSGAVVHSAPSITGPWTRQARDANCKADAPICAGMASEQGEKERPTGALTIAAQGIAISHLPNAAVGGGDVILWNGMRWLSGPNNPPKCDTLCTAPTGVCEQDPAYHTAEDFDYWVPLSFDGQTGEVLQFESFVDEFQLEV